MCYSAAALANYFITKAQRENVQLTHMHLQKMLFFAHAFYFKSTGKPLFVDPVTAWQHGPVIEPLYYELRQYGGEAITAQIQRLKRERDNGGVAFRTVTPEVDPNDGELLRYLDSVWNVLGKEDTWKLRARSHLEGGAWYKTVAKLKKEDGSNVNPENDDEVRQYLPRHLTILDDCIRECGR